MDYVMDPMVRRTVRTVGICAVVCCGTLYHVYGITQPLLVAAGALLGALSLWLKNKIGGTHE